MENESSNKSVIFGVVGGLVGLVVFVIILAACGAFHQHEWQEATCQAPRTCTECGKTEGGLGDHDWVDGGCMKPDYCKICKATGEPAEGHKYSGDTCTVCQQKMFYNALLFLAEVMTANGTTDEGGDPCIKIPQGKGDCRVYISGVGEEYIKVITSGRSDDNTQGQIQMLLITPRSVKFTITVLNSKYDYSMFSAYITKNGVGDIDFEENGLGIIDNAESRNQIYDRAKALFSDVSGITYKSSGKGIGFTFEEYLEACC